MNLRGGFAKPVPVAFIRLFTTVLPPFEAADGRKMFPLDEGTTPEPVRMLIFADWPPVWKNFLPLVL